MTLPSNYDCAIIGAGIIGLLTARELHQAGLKVVVVERQQVGRESSWAGGGIISPLYPWRYPAAVSALAAWGQVRYRELCAELAQLSGVDPEWTASGLLMAHLTESELELAERWLQAWPMAHQHLSSSQMAALEPNLNLDPASSGLLLPAIAQVRNPRLARAAVGAVRRLGIEIREQWPLEQMEPEGEGFQLRGSEGRLIRAERVVVCAGAWSGGLAEQWLERVPVAPVKGQMILYPMPVGFMQRITLIEGHYFIPRRDGSLLFGSTLEPEAGFDQTPTEIALAELQTIAAGWVPSLAAQRPSYHWAGLRPGSMNDGIPIIAPSRHLKGLFYNSGHFRNGVVLGLASARLMADQVLERPPILDPTPYQLPNEPIGGESV